VHGVEKVVRVLACGERASFRFAVGVLRNIGIHFAVNSLEVDIRRQGRSTLVGSGDVDDIEIVFLDGAVQMDIDEVKPRCLAPVAEQPRFDVRQFERLLEQRVVVEINLPHRQIVRCPPVGVHSFPLVCG